MAETTVGIRERMPFVFEQIRTGGDRNLAYVVGDRRAGEAAVVDPSFDPQGVVERAEAQGLETKHVVNTHGHPDHTNGNDAARRRTGAPLAAWHEAASRPDVALRDGETLTVGALTLRFLHTPGHADDHLVIHIAELDAAITGDLLFVGKIGGTATDEDARTEHQSLERLLRELPGTTTVWPGHDFGARPASTLALERATNPFLLARDVDEFLQLKRDWPELKRELGLR